MHYTMVPPFGRRCLCLCAARFSARGTSGEAWVRRGGIAAAWAMIVTVTTSPSPCFRKYRAGKRARGGPAVVQCAACWRRRGGHRRTRRGTYACRALICDDFGRRCDRGQRSSTRSATTARWSDPSRRTVSTVVTRRPLTSTWSMRNSLGPFRRGAQVRAGRRPW